MRGKVLPIGGLKEKLLAAHRAGIREAILPAENKRDLADLPDLIKNEMKLNWVEQMDEVLEIALVSKPLKLAEETPAALTQTAALPIPPPKAGREHRTPVALQPSHQEEKPNLPGSAFLLARRTQVLLDGAPSARHEVHHQQRSPQRLKGMWMSKLLT